MSIKSWYEKHYPVSAYSIEDAKGSIEHSLQKWKGFRKENMEAHEVHFNNDASIVDPNYTLIGHNNETVDTFSISEPSLEGGSSCALCHLFLSMTPLSNRHSEERCNKCPIVKSGSLMCFNRSSPYMKSTRNNPEPMIQALEKALEWYNLQVNEEG